MKIYETFWVWNGKNFTVRIFDECEERCPECQNEEPLETTNGFFMYDERLLGLRKSDWYASIVHEIFEVTMMQHNCRWNPGMYQNTYLFNMSHDEFCIICDEAAYNLKDFLEKFEDRIYLGNLPLVHDCSAEEEGGEEDANL